MKVQVKLHRGGHPLTYLVEDDVEVGDEVEVPAYPRFLGSQYGTVVELGSDYDGHLVEARKVRR